MYLLLLWPYDIYPSVLSYSLLNSGIIGYLLWLGKLFLNQLLMNSFSTVSHSHFFFTLFLFLMLIFLRRRKKLSKLYLHITEDTYAIWILSLLSPSLLNLLFPKFCFPLLVLILHYKNPANHLATAESSLERGQQTQSAKARALFSI